MVMMADKEQTGGNTHVLFLTKPMKARSRLLAKRIWQRDSLYPLPAARRMLDRTS